MIINGFIAPDFYYYENNLKEFIKDRLGCGIKDFYIGVITKNHEYIHELFGWIIDLHELDRKRIGLVVRELPENVCDVRCYENDGSYYRLLYRQLLIDDKQYYYRAITGYARFVDVPELFK